MTSKVVPEHNGQRRCLQFTINLLYMFGFWPASKDERNRRVELLRFWFPIVILVRMCYGIVFNLINMADVYGDVGLTIQFFIAGGIHLNVLVRSATLVYFRSDIRAIVDTLERLHRPAMLHDRRMREAMARAERRTNNFTKYLLIAFTVVSTIFITVLVVQGIITRVIPFRRYLPYDYHYSPMFEATLICTSFFQTVDLILMADFELICIAVLMLLIKQFELLQYKLQNLRLSVDIKLSRRRMKAVSKMRQEVKVAKLFRPDTRSGDDAIVPFAEREEDDLNEDDVNEQKKEEELEQRQLESKEVDETDVEVPVEAVPEGATRTPDCGDKDTVEDAGKLSPDTDDQQDEGEGGGSECSVDEDQEMKNEDEMKEADIWVAEHAPSIASPDTQEEMDLYLRHCVRHHQLLLWLVDEIRRVLKYTNSFLVMNTAMGGLIFIYISTLARKMDVAVFGLALITFSLYFVFLMYCWYGNLLFDEAMKVRDAAYDCDWFGASSGFKATLRVIIARCERPLLIKGGGLAFSMKNFRLVIRSAYYGHTLLGKLYHGEKIDLSKYKTN